MIQRVGCLSGLLFGGNANNGTNCGFVYANANNVPANANANIGSRIYSQSLSSKDNDLATWQKISFTQQAVGRATEHRE